MKTTSIITTVKLTILVVLFSLSTFAIGDNVNYKLENTAPTLPLISMEDSVVYEINRLQFKYPHIVLAQAKLESGNFTSNVFQRNKNMFGMKMPSRRPTTAVKQKSSYAYYDTWVHSVIDQRIYYAIYLEHKTEEQVYAYLSKYYAEDPHYVQSLKKIIQREKLKEKFFNDNVI
jgi:hypothetical protein